MARSRISYRASLCTTNITGGAVGEGKSGMLFFFSHDGRFILKTLKEDEFELFRRILPSYAAHMAKVRTRPFCRKRVAFWHVAARNGVALRGAERNDASREEEMYGVASLHHSTSDRVARDIRAARPWPSTRARRCCRGSTACTCCRRLATRGARLSRARGVRFVRPSRSRSVESYRSIDRRRCASLQKRGLWSTQRPATRLSERPPPSARRRRRTPLTHPPRPLSRISGLERSGRARDRLVAVAVSLVAAAASSTRSFDALHPIIGPQVSFDRDEQRVLHAAQDRREVRPERLDARPVVHSRLVVRAQGDVSRCY